MSKITADMLRQAVAQVKPSPIILVAPGTMEEVRPLLKEAGLDHLVHVSPYLPNDMKFYIIDRSVIPNEWENPSFRSQWKLQQE